METTFTAELVKSAALDNMTMEQEVEADSIISAAMEEFRAKYLAAKRLGGVKTTSARPRDNVGRREEVGNIRELHQVLSGRNGWRWESQ